MKKFLPIIFLILITGAFFKNFFIKGLIPLPADTIVGMYHPWRDIKWDNYPNGVPYKNSLITDPVRQQYPWKKLAIDQMKAGKLPIWNPYTFSGSPLLANFQSGVFYPLNIIFFLLPFNTAWAVYIYLQFLVGSLFMYFYLKNLKLQTPPAVLGSLAFIFSGVFIAWGWWGNVIHTLIWLPLILLCIDKITYFRHPGLDPGSISLKSSEFRIKSGMTKVFIWPVIFIFSLTSSFFAGHLQIFFYVFLVTIIYLIVETQCIVSLQRSGRISSVIQTIKQLVKYFLPLFLLVAIITSIQSIPAFQFILQSARNMDQANWHTTGWFIPWQNLLQFFAPDFFGNPATLNYWGVWNYGEFIGYVGILPLMLAVYAMVFGKDKKVLFFGSFFFLSLLFSLPTFLAAVPYALKIPFISTSQPTRLLVITDFSLSVLASLGLDKMIKAGKLKDLLKIISPFAIVYLGLELFTKFGNLPISNRNLIFPLLIFGVVSILLPLFILIKNHKIKIVILTSIFIILIVDLFRFGWKFLPFTGEEWIYPKTKTIEFLQLKQNDGPYRIMSTDERIFPPNFSIVYKIETIDGYDPLYLKSYADLINRMENRNPNSSFNRIITPKNFESPITDKLNVRYVLSLADLKSAKLKKVFQEGETRVYENLNFIKSPYFQNDYKY